MAWIVLVSWTIGNFKGGEYVNPYYFESLCIANRFYLCISERRFI